MIVCGVADNTLRERLLRDGDLTLEKAIAVGHAAEVTSCSGAQRTPRIS